MIRLLLSEQEHSSWCMPCIGMRAFSLCLNHIANLPS